LLLERLVGVVALPQRFVQFKDRAVKGGNVVGQLRDAVRRDGSVVGVGHAY